MIYVVFGECGQYSDHSQWPIRAFLTAAEAEAYQKECQSWADANVNGLRDAGTWWDRSWEEREAIEKQSPDPHFSSDYTGTKYGLWSLPLGSADPTSVRSEDERG